MQHLRGLLAFALPPLGYVVGLYAVLQGINALWLDLPLRLSAMPLDLALHLVLAVALLCLSRSRRAFAGLMTLLMAALHLGNALKIATLGGPVMPDDAHALVSLLLILEPWQLAGAAAFGLALAGALAWSLTLRPRAARAAAGVLALGSASVLAAPATVAGQLDATVGNVVWNQRANYLSRGPLLHLVQEGARYAARSEAAPPRGAVLTALDTLRPPLHPAALSVLPEAKPPAPTAAPRNVHMIVLESFWDPSVLTDAGLTGDPLAPAFRALWDAAGHSRALSPVFGGYTANAEFEALCGFPVTEDAVFFEARLRNAAPCLPALFGEAGYTSVASHPNIAAFWNRVNAYDRVGFDAYWSESDFALDDMNGDFLGDSSLYRQVFDKVEPLLDSGTPTFNYILTFFGHLDYPLNESRPRVLQAPGDDRLERYANTVYYKSQELMDVLPRLLERDPDSIVVIFGDHLPFLGANFEAYAASGVSTGDRGTFTPAMVRDMAATPLIVIDGRKGPLALGDLPLFQLPGILRHLARLDDSPAPLDLTGGPVVRPLPGMQLVIDEDGQPHICRDGQDAPACDVSRQWLGAVETIGTDLFSGKQHILNDLKPRTTPQPADEPAGQTALLMDRAL